MPDSTGSGFKETKRAPFFKRGRVSVEAAPSSEEKARRFSELAKAFLKKALEKDKAAAKIIGKGVDFEVYLSAIPEDDKERLVETVMSRGAKISDAVARGFQKVVEKYVEEKMAASGAKRRKTRPSAPPVQTAPPPTEMAGLSKKEQLELQGFVEKHLGLLTQIAALQDDRDERVTQNPQETKERLDQLYEKLLKKLPKALKKGIGEEAIRRSLESYVTHYRRFMTQLKEQIEVPDTKEGQETMLRSFMDQLEVTPEKEIQTNDPLAAMLLAEFRKSARVADVPNYPAGSGMVARTEQTGVPVMLENVAGVVETSAISVGFMMLLKTMFPLADVIIYPVSVGVAIAVSYGANIPFKNKGLREIARTGKILPSVYEVAAKNPGYALILAGTVLAAIAPAVNESVERGLTSQAIAHRVGEVLDPAVEALGESADRFPAFIRDLRGQLAALVEAEAHPSRIEALQIQHPGMTFGESGDEGEGPVYWAKQRLFFDASPGADVPAGMHPNAEMLRIVAQARAEAGLAPGESLPDALEASYEHFLEETEARRERIAELVARIAVIRAEVEKQNAGSIAADTFFLGKAPRDPQEMEPLREELAELLVAQGEAYEAMQAEAQRRIE